MQNPIRLTLALIPLVGLVGCASDPQPIVVNEPTVIEKEGGLTFVREPSLELKEKEIAGAGFREKDRVDVLFNKHLGSEAKSVISSATNAKAVKPMEKTKSVQGKKSSEQKTHDKRDFSIYGKR